MNLGEWQAKLVESVMMDGALLYLARKVPEGREFLLRDGTTKLTKTGAVASDEELHFAVLTHEQLTATAEAFSTFGIKTPDSHKLEGLLQAKDDHLQDMRALVFKERKR